MTPLSSFLLSIKKHHMHPNPISKNQNRTSPNAPTPSNNSEHFWALSFSVLNDGGYSNWIRKSQNPASKIRLLELIQDSIVNINVSFHGDMKRVIGTLMCL